MSKTIKIPAMEVNCDKDIPRQIAELKRELSLRKTVYRNQVNAGKLDRNTANTQYNTLLSTLKLLQAIYAHGMGVQAQLFTGGTLPTTQSSTHQNQ